MRIAIAVLLACLGCSGTVDEPNATPPEDSAVVANDDTAVVAVPDTAVASDSAFDTQAPPLDAPSAAHCSSGGQLAGSTGAEAPFGEAVVGLCRRALGCTSTWTLAPPPEGYRNKGTPNHKLLWRIWYYGWAMEAGTATQKTDARDFLREFFDAQVTYGHQSLAGADEVLNTSHYQIWSNGMTCARLLAVDHADTSLLDATGRWWRGEKALYDLLQRGGSIDAPGARFKPGQAGPSQLRDVLYAMIRKAPLPKLKDTWWSDYYNVSAWTLRELLRLGDDLGGAATATAKDLPSLHDPLYVRVKDDDYVFEFPRMRDALQPLFWVASVGGVKSYAPYVDGTPVTSATPAPTLTGATVTIVPGAP